MDLIWTWLGIIVMFGISAMCRVLRARWCPFPGRLLDKKAARQESGPF